MRVLIIRLSALGDVLTATPAASLLRRAVPDAHITWLVERHCAELLAGNAAIDRVVEVPRSREWRRMITGRGPRPAEVRALLGALRAEPFDVVLDLQGLVKSALYAAVARAPRKLRAADAYEPAPGIFTDSVERRIDPGCVTSLYTSMLRPLGVVPDGPADGRMTLTLDDATRQSAAGWLAAAGLTAGGFLALIPGTTRPQKHWVEESWPRVAARLHRRLGLPAVIVGGPAEGELAARIIARATSPILDATGAFGLRACAAVLEAARLSLAVDTGPMHMAVAVGCPTVAIFGSTPPRWFGEGLPYVALSREFPCSPCHRRPTCRRFECLHAVRPEDVARAGEELLSDG